MTMKNARNISVALFLLFAVISSGGTAFAGEVLPYDMKAFAAAQVANKTILIHVYADWCPTCRKQGPMVETLSKDKAFSNAAVFRLNFDKDEQVLKMFNVQHQSVLIVFKGKSEVGRSIGETNPQKIRALFEKGL
jgi:thiol-disulfide isomerase/thioredoxin